MLLFALFAGGGGAIAGGEQRALHFAATPDHPRPHVEIGLQTPFNVVQALTVEAWVKLKVYDPGQFPPKWQALVTKGEAWGLTRHSNTNQLAFRTGSDGAVHSLASATVLTPGEWTHVAAVWDGQTKRIYLDGELDAVIEWAGPLAANPFRPTIGANGEFPDRVFEGELDAVRIWGVARSRDELQSTMRRSLTGSESGLLGCWRFDTVTILPDGVPDASAQQAHGTLRDLDPATALAPGIRMGAPWPTEHALALNGVDQHVAVVPESLFDFTVGMTVVADVYLDALPIAEAALVAKGDDAWQLTVGSDGRVRFHGNGLTPAVLTAATPLELGRWTHVAATWGDGALTILLDGAPDAWALGVGGSVSTNDRPVMLGAAPDATGQPTARFAGRLDNVSLWDRARLPAAIAAAIGRELAGHELGLVGAWDFNEGGGPIAADRRRLAEPASVTLAFADLEHEDDAVVAHGTQLERDGFRVSVGPSGALASLGTLHESHCGATALHADAVGDELLLERLDGQPFRLLSLELANLDGAAEPPVQVTFVGTLASGAGDVVQTLALPPGGAARQKLVFTAFNAVNAVRWVQEAPGHQFANLVAHAVTGLPPASVKADGQLVGLADFARVDGARALGDALPAQYALRFDGATQYVQTPPAAAFELSACTIEAWVKPEPSLAAPAQFRTIARQGDLGWGLALDPEGYLRYFVDHTSENAVRSIRAVADGVWQHVAVTVNPATNTVVFYIDGRYAGEVERHELNNTPDPLVIGRLGPNTDAGYFRGDLDEVRVWDHERDADVVAFFANAPLPDGLDGLVARWSFDDGAGTTAADHSPNSLDATLLAEGGGAVAEWVAGPSGPFRDRMYALYFDGQDDHLRIPHTPAFDFAPALTLEAWIWPEPNPTEDGLRTVLMKGDCNAALTGYGLALDAAGHLCFWLDANPGNVAKSTATVDDERWQHVAVAVDAAAATFYIDGVLAGTRPLAPINNNAEDLLVGRQGLTNATARNHFKGLIDELRLWNVARSAAEIAAAAGHQLPGATPSLVAYWRFNDHAAYLDLDDDARAAVNALEARDETAGLAASLVNMDIGAWQPSLYSLDWDGEYWETDPVPVGMNLSLDPRTRGLWIGTVQLAAVTELATARRDRLGTLSPTRDSAAFTVLLHVDTGGRVRLLKDVIVMRALDSVDEETVEEDEVDDPADVRLALITDPLRIPHFRGVVVRRGKQVGQRYGTTAYDFEGYEQLLMGGVGPGKAVRGTLILPRTHATNPFRHRYHPDHRNVSDINPNYGREISREIAIVFAATEDDDIGAGGYGVDRLEGTYREVVTGLTKFPLETAGLITLNRVCDVGKLNE